MLYLFKSFFSSHSDCTAISTLYLFYHISQTLVIDNIDLFSYGTYNTAMADPGFVKKIIILLSYYREKFTPASLRPRALKRWFKKCNGRTLSLDPPVTWCDKINWIKLYGVTPEMTRLSDKYLVRDWVKEKIGEEYLIPLLGVWDSFDEIDFSTLPDKFVLKTNHACRTNLIVTDKSRMDKKSARKDFKRWMMFDFAYRFGFQMQYLKIRRKIIAEEFLENGGNDLLDYKFHCFNGVPVSCEYIGGRSENETRLAFFDMDWKLLPYRTSTYPLCEVLPEKPSNYEKMAEIAKTLSEGFPYVRVDLYHLNDGSIKFGEMTFTPSSGQSGWIPEGTDEMLGKMIDLKTVS